MLTVHHLDHSRSQRVLWLLEEIGLPYEIVRYRRDPATMLAPASLRQVHPLGKSPVVTTEGLTLVESGAIIEYLVQHHGAGLAPPPDTPERLLYTQWLHYAEGSLMPLLLLALVMRRMPRGMPAWLRPLGQMMTKGAGKAFVRPQLALHLGFLESELARRPWFAGEQFSAADIQMGFPLQMAVDRAGLDARYPQLSAFLARIRQRPAYQRAQAIAGDDDGA